MGKQAVGRQTEEPDNLRAIEPCDSWHGKQDPRNSGSLGRRLRDEYTSQNTNMNKNRHVSHLKILTIGFNF